MAQTAPLPALTEAIPSTIAHPTTDPEGEVGHWLHRNSATAGGAMGDAV